MTLQECTVLLAEVAVTLGCRVDAVTYRAYHRALQDVPLELMRAGCDLAVRLPKDPYAPKWPTAPTFRAFAEQARQAWLKAHPFEPCASCAENAGFIETRDAKGYIRLARCECWKVHQARISAAGMSTQLALPPAREEVEA